MKRLALFLILAPLCFAQELRRPTADIAVVGGMGCFGVNNASAAMTLSYDAAGLTTFSSLSVQGSQTQTKYREREFMTWQTTANTYTTLTLNVNSSAQEVTSGSSGVMYLAYSIDGGSHWAIILSDSSGAGWPRQTSTVSLTAGQDLTKLRIGSCVTGAAGGDTVGSTDTVNIWDIWTSGTVTGQPAGTGSSSGNAGRNVVSIRRKQHGNVSRNNQWHI